MLNNLSANISESVLATIASSEFTIDLLDLKQQTWQRFDTVSEGALDALKVRGQVALSSDLLRYLFNCVEDKPPGFFGCIENAVLSSEALAGLLSKAGFYASDKTFVSLKRQHRTLSESFCIIMGMTAVSIDQETVFDWFRTMFGPVVDSAILAYDAYNAAGDESDSAGDGKISKKRRRIDDAPDKAKQLRNTILLRVRDAHARRSTSNGSQAYKTRVKRRNHSRNSSPILSKRSSQATDFSDSVPTLNACTISGTDVRAPVKTASRAGQAPPLQDIGNLPPQISRLNTPIDIHLENVFRKHLKVRDPTPRSLHAARGTLLASENIDVSSDSSPTSTPRKHPKAQGRKVDLLRQVLLPVDRKRFDGQF